MEKPQNRAEAMIDLFATHCLPMATGQTPPDAQDLVQMNTIPHIAEWADHASKLLLSRSGPPLEQNAQHCSISDALTHLNETERAAVATALPELLQTRLPHFKPGQPYIFVPDWEPFLLWKDATYHDAAHAPAVALVHFAKSGEAANTEISLTLPAN
jgi:hypothetical protein